MWHLSFTMQPTLVSHSLHNSQLPSHVPSHKTLQGIQLLKHTLCSVHSFSALPTKGYWLSWHLGWQVIFRINSWTACYPQCTRWTTKGKMIDHQTCIFQKMFHACVIEILLILPVFYLPYLCHCEWERFKGSRPQRFLLWLEPSSHSTGYVRHVVRAEGLIRSGRGIKPGVLNLSHPEKVCLPRSRCIILRLTISKSQSRNQWRVSVQWHLIVRA